MDLINFQIPTPANVVLAGSTGSGKTHLTLEIIRRRSELFAENLDKVVYIYPEFQATFHQLQATDPNVRFTQDLKELETLYGPCLLVVDDQQDVLGRGENNDLIKRMFIKNSHHRLITCLLILQNPFVRGLRDVNLNTQVHIQFDSPRDRSVIQSISRQVCPGRTKLLVDAYNAAVSTRVYSYLVIDLHPKNKAYKYWLRSHLFPCEDCEVFA